MTKYDEYQNYKRYKIVLPHMKIYDIEQISSHIDCYYFYGLSLKQLKELIKFNFVDIAYEHGMLDGKISLQQVIELLEEYPKLRLGGYIINNRRQDARVSVTGVILQDKSALNKILKLGLIPNVETLEELNKHEENHTLHKIKYWWFI